MHDIRALRDNPALYDAARERILSAFSLDSVADRLCALYDRLLNSEPLKD